MDSWDDSQKEQLLAIINRDPSALLREASTDFNFLEVKEKLLNILDQVTTVLKNYDFWAELPETKRTNLNSVLNDMVTQFQEMETFDPKQNNAWERRNNIIANFNSRYNGFYEHVVVPLNGYLGRKAYSQELGERFGQQAEKELNEIKRVKKEIDKIQANVLDAASVASGDVASTAQAVSFGDQAKEHDKAAIRWLRAIAGFGLVALVLTVMVVEEIIKELRDNNQSFTANAETNILKVALLAFLYFGLRFIIRNYSAHRHLYIVNKHRANVLKSMDAFRTSALDNQAKDSILLAAVGVAYAQQETGFITTKEGAGSDDSELINVVKMASGK